MRSLWKLIKNNVSEEKAYAVFLAVNILVWSVATLAVGMLFCIVAGGVAVENCVTNVMCMAVYAGIIFGLFGGIIFLMREDNHRNERFI